MVDAPKYRVVISGTVLPEKSRAEAITQLAELFHSAPDKMEELLQGKAVPLVKEYERGQAEKVCSAIRTAGVACEIEKIESAEQAEEQSPSHKSVAQSKESEKSEESEKVDTDQSESASASDEPEPSIEEAAVLSFVGFNTRYYRRQFAKFGSIQKPSFAVTWHWGAFFAFFFWAVYRKLWQWAALHFIGSLILLYMSNPGLLYLVWVLFWPLTANYLYFRHARRQVTLHEHEYMEDEHDTTDSVPIYFFGGGGVNRIALWISVLVMFSISFAYNDTFTERMLDRYSERMSTVLPPGSQQRGDGSSIDSLLANEPTVARTVASLGVLALTLRLLVDDGADDHSQALSTFQKYIDRKEIVDAWGTEILVKQEIGRFVLTSAGPDAQFGNSDDILQFVYFDWL